MVMLLNIVLIICSFAVSINAIPSSNTKAEGSEGKCGYEVTNSFVKVTKLRTIAKQLSITPMSDLLATCFLTGFGNGVVNL